MKRESDQGHATPQRDWALGPDGWKDVIAYVSETPDLAAMLVELGVYEHLEHHSEECEHERDTIFTIANHWREREIALSARSATRPDYHDDLVDECAALALCANPNDGRDHTDCPFCTIARDIRNIKFRASVAQSESAACNDLAVQELENILKAERFNPGRFLNDTDFADWARSRCQFTLDRIKR